MKRVTKLAIALCMLPATAGIARAQDTSRPGSSTIQQIVSRMGPTVCNALANGVTPEKVYETTFRALASFKDPSLGQLQTPEAVQRLSADPTAVRQLNEGASALLRVSLDTHCPQRRAQFRSLQF